MRDLMYILINRERLPENENKALLEECKRALKKIIQKCKQVRYLDELIADVDFMKLIN